MNLTLEKPVLGAAPSLTSALTVIGRQGGMISSTILQAYSNAPLISGDQLPVYCTLKTLPPFISRMEGSPQMIGLAASETKFSVSWYTWPLEGSMVERAARHMAIIPFSLI